MASLLTQCPHCQTSFRVSRSQLAVAEGQVRCGSCLGVFSARDNEIRVKPPLPPLLDEPLTAAELSSVAASDDDTDPDAGDATAESADAAEYPEYEDVPAPRERTGSWLDDDDELEYEDDADLVTAQAPDPRNAEVDEEDLEAARNEYAGEEYADEYDDEPVLREPVMSEPLLREPMRREPVLGLADDEPRFSADARRDAAAEPGFSLFADDGKVEPGFSAIDDDDAVGDYRAVRSRYAADERDAKRQVHRYLDEIENEDALDELAPDTLDYLDDEPVHLAPPPAPSRFWSSLLLGLGSLALLALLALQFIDAHVEELNQSARFALLRPFLCGVIDCPPAPEAPSTLVSEQLVVRAHPDVRDALEVSAVLRNNGAATQPLPGVELIFRDGQDQVVASRVFTPEEYLPRELRTAMDLPSQSSVQVQLELANPGPEALNYELAFRPLPDDGAP